MSLGILFFGRKTCNFSHVIRQQLFQRHLAHALVCVRQRSNVFHGRKALALLGNERKFLVILEICQSNEVLLDLFIRECTLQYLEAFFSVPGNLDCTCCCSHQCVLFLPSSHLDHCPTGQSCTLRLHYCGVTLSSRTQDFMRKSFFENVDLDYSGSSGLQDVLLMFIISPVSSWLDTQIALLCCFALLLFCERTDI